MGKIMLNGISYGSLTSSPHMIKHGDLSLYQALKFLENKIIIGSGTPNSSMGRNGDLYISYDSAPPELNVGTPAGTSASNPTLLTSTTNVNYQVTGTVNDYGSGVSSVTVNGQPATISGTNWSCTLTLATNANHTIKVTATDKAGYSTTVTRYLTIYDNTAKNYSYNGGIQTFTAPIDGTYSLTAKGARGGYGKSTTYRGGYGGTATGQITLAKGTVLYICCGGAGVDATSTGSDKRAGGYNGGGNTYGTSGKYTGSGGGATHIATANGILSSLSGNKGAILMVAGGGGGGGYESDSYTSTGGHGGGTSGGNGTTTNTSYTTGKGGSQTAGGAGHQGAGSFGQGGHATSDAIGGGGGYYGGGSGQYTCGGGGGSGYLSSSLTSSSMTTGNNNAAGSAIIQLLEPIFDWVESEPEEPAVDPSLVYENGVLYDTNVKTTGKYLTTNWNNNGKLTLTTYDSAWGGHWYIYDFTKPANYTTLNILVSGLTANDTRPWIRIYAQDSLNTSTESINHNGNYSSTEVKPGNSNITLTLSKNAGNQLVCYGGVYNATQSTTTISKIWWS